MNKIARLLALIVAASATLLSAPHVTGAGEPPPVTGWMEQFSFIDPPRPAPRTGFLAGTGAPVTIADFRGRVLLVNFWATWCAPCIRELPSLDKLQARLGDEGLLVLAVSQDRGGAAVAGPFLKKLGVIGLGLFLDPRMELGRALGVRALPWSALVDREGRVVGMLPGYAEWDSAEGVALIRHYLAQDGDQGAVKERIRKILESGASQIATVSPSQLKSIGPDDLHMHVVEFRVFQVAAMPYPAARRQGCQPDFLSFRDDVTEGLVFDKPVAQVDDAFLQGWGNMPNADIRPAKFAHPAGMDPIRVRFVVSRH